MFHLHLPELYSAVEWKAYVCATNDNTNIRLFLP